jgi:hypothetical protein
MGRWEYPGHRVWPWLLDKEQNVVYQQSYQSIHAYILLVQCRTRSGGLHIYLGEVNIIPIKVVPISVDKVESDIIVDVGGPLLGGRTWMWDYVPDVTSEPSWLLLALERGTAVLATDGSYDRRRGPNVSGAGWVIACPRSGKILKG